MKKLYYLSTCTTCDRIMNELGDLLKDFEKQDIKSEAMSLEQIDQMEELSGSYESLFSTKAMKFRSRGLAGQELLEHDYRRLIQEEYTFLKRPVFIVDDLIFIGNSKKELDRLKETLN
ncbi:MAG: arsenate reductase [Cytophagales bacterium]|nr:arsenate reductase [Cytophagales bacterium]